MKDAFFTKTKCDRCKGSLSAGRIMSTYNTDCICMDCKKAETKRSDYKFARDTELNEVIKGNLNYQGVGL